MKHFTALLSQAGCEFPILKNAGSPHFNGKPALLLHILRLKKTFRCAVLYYFFFFFPATTMMIIIAATTTTATITIITTVDELLDESELVSSSAGEGEFDSYSY